MFSHAIQLTKATSKQRLNPPPLRHTCVSQATVSHVVKSILSTSFILGFASVVFNLKSRFCKENAWQVSRLCQLRLSGDGN